MAPRALIAGLTVVLVLAAGCGADDDGGLPDRSTTTTDAGAAGTTSSTRPPITTTTRPPITTTTRPPLTTTTDQTDESTTTTEAPTTTTTVAPTTTTTAPTTTTAAPTTTTAAPTTTATPTTEDEVAGAPVSEETEQDDGTPWRWLVLALAAGLVALLWARSRSTTPWDAQALQLAQEIEAAGRSVLLGPDLTPDLWTNALSHSTQIRSGAQDVVEHAPTPAARQAVEEACEALRLAEVQANTARTTPGTDLTAASAQLSAAVERLRALTRPVPPTP